LTPEDAIRWHIGQCEEAINRRDPQGMVDHTSSAARLGNRVLMVAKQEADNSEDPVYNAKINRAADGLQSGELLASQSPLELLIFHVRNSSVCKLV
jgi:vinculin